MGWFSRRSRDAQPGHQDGAPRPPRPELPRGRSTLSVDRAGTDDVRNLAMAVVLMWGPTRGLPAVDRLCRFVDGLDLDTAATMVADARAAEQIANNHVYDHSDYTGEQIAFAPRPDVDALVLARFPWVDEDNLSHVYSQSCYGAWHG